MRATAEEVFLPFPMERSAIPLATHFRSTWLASSVRTLRERGLLDGYLAALPVDCHDRVLNPVVGVWLPMELAISHYRACDTLGLSTLDLLEIGNTAARRAEGPALSISVRVATGSGITPWSILAQGQRIWSRTFRGGGVAGFKLGPKEARFEIVGYPCAGFRYNRVTMRGILQFMFGLFCTRVYVHEIAPLCTETTLGFRVSWA